LREHARAQDREVWVALASFAEDYLAVRSRMRGAHRDAAGLVREAALLARQLLEGDVARGTTVRVRALLVDDAQELTLGGVELLEACRATGVAVLAFGDPDIGSGVPRCPPRELRAAGVGSARLRARRCPPRHRGAACSRRR
jgi:hypothetical protein